MTQREWYLVVFVVGVCAYILAFVWTVQTAYGVVPRTEDGMPLWANGFAVSLTGFSVVAFLLGYSLRSLRSAESA